MALQFKEDSLYGFSHLAERFQEKPFFLRNNGLCGEKVARGSWKLDFDPASCANDVCSVNSLEDIVIYFLHVRQYHYGRNFLPQESFNIVHSVMMRIFGRIASEIAPGYPIDLDTAMAASNLITIFREIVNRSYSILHRIKSPVTLQQNYESLDRFHCMLSRDITYGNKRSVERGVIQRGSCRNLCL